MFFPIGDINIKRGAKPIFTYLFLISNICIFVYQFLLPPGPQNAFVQEYGCIPLEITRLKDLHTLVTCIFLHGGWMHLLGNMLFLYVFADNIEATIGNIRFLLFYIGGGVAASLAHAIFNLNSPIPCVGASGAIAACLGAYLIMFPFSKIKIFFILFLTTFNISAMFFLGFWIIQQFLSGIGEIGATTAGVAYWAHIGGFAFGIFFGFMFRAKALTMEHEV